MMSAAPPTSFRLILPRSLYGEMIEHARAELPNECCGMLAGAVVADGGRAVVEKRHPLVNEAASPREYRATPQSLFAAHKTMRLQGHEVLAIYHSHPTSLPIPSKTDLERNNHPEAIHLILSLLGEVETRAWWLGENGYREAEWEIVD